MTELQPKPIYPPISDQSQAPDQPAECKPVLRPKHRWRRALKTGKHIEKAHHLSRPSPYTDGRYSDHLLPVPTLTNQGKQIPPRNASARHEDSTKELTSSDPITSTLSCLVEELTSATTEIQKWFEEQEGIHYELPDLKQVLTQWLESSVEQLVSDAPWHCCTSSDRYSFNRNGFQAGLEQLNRRLDRENSKITD
jgi:hypothetical protein